MRVLNKYKDPIPRNAIYIGRGSPYGNPFVIGKDGTREEVIALHRQWLIDEIVKRNQTIITPLLNLPDDGDLVCFCKPAACHGDTIIEISTAIKQDLSGFIVQHTPFHPSRDGIDHVNIYTKGQTELGRGLSNMAHTPFIHPRYGAFQTVEGFWYYVGTGHKHEVLREALGHHAKKIGRAYERVHNPLFEREVLEAIDAKLRAHPWLLELLKVNTLPLTHYYWYGNLTNAKIVMVTDCDWILDHFKTYMPEP